MRLFCLPALAQMITGGLPSWLVLGSTKAQGPLSGGPAMQDNLAVVLATGAVAQVILMAMGAIGRIQEDLRLSRLNGIAMSQEKTTTVHLRVAAILRMDTALSLTATHRMVGPPPELPRGAVTARQTAPHTGSRARR